jgi:Tol biopolymer transport system component
MIFLPIFEEWGFAVELNHLFFQRSPFMLQVQLRKLSIPLGVLVSLVLLSTGCQGKTITPAPIILGGFPSLNSPMQEVYRYETNSKSLVSITERAPNVSYFESPTFHNSTPVFSFDQKYMAINVLNSSGSWTLNILDVNQNNGKPIFTSPIGTKLPLLYEGFSNDGHYFGFTYSNDSTGSMDLGVLDLVTKGSMISLPSAHFVDFSADDQVYALTFLSNGNANGLVKFDPASEKVETIFQPPADVILDLVILSPDQKWILYTDRNIQTLNRVSISGDNATMIYQYSGENPLINYDKSGRYLIVIDPGSNQSTLKVYDQNFKETYSLSGVGWTNMDFSNDGRFFTYQLFGLNGMDLYLNDFKSQTYYLLASTGKIYTPRISPDNKYLVYLSIANSGDHGGTLFLVQLKDLHSTKIDASVTSFKFDTDSSLLYVKLNDTNQTSSLFRQVPGESTPTPLLSDAKGILFLLQ